ncbi:hypothetical protein D1007_29287 [Hordeum vulgare]|nr:hypothetical protein D1007_29287 [Hordeum vulgare]
MAKEEPLSTNLGHTRVIARLPEIATYHPSAPTYPPSPVAALETRRQKHARDAFFTTMDLVLKAYLDKMNDDVVSRAAKQDDDNKAILKAMATQSAWIDALVSWKME